MPDHSADERRPLEEIDDCKHSDGWHCPFCSSVLKTEGGLRGHASGKHAVLWEKRKKSQAVTEFDFGQLKTYDEYEVDDLKPWHRLAIFQHAVLGHSYAAIASALDRHESTIQPLMKSPAAKQMRSNLQEMMSDDERLLKIVLQASAVGVTMDDMTALQWAKDNKDYEFVHKFAMDYYDMGGIDRQGEGGGQHITINLDSGSLDDVPAVRSWSEPLDAEIVDDDV